MGQASMRKWLRRADAEPPRLGGELKLRSFWTSDWRRNLALHMRAKHREQRRFETFKKVVGPLLLARSRIKLVAHTILDLV